MKIRKERGLSKRDVEGVFWCMFFVDFHNVTVIGR